MRHKTLLSNTLAAAAALAFSAAPLTSALAADKTSAADKMEKCYGIVKAGMNDCQTATASCAGSATKDNQRDAFVFLTKGECAKITGSSLTSSDPVKAK